MLGRPWRLVLKLPFQPVVFEVFFNFLENSFEFVNTIVVCSALEHKLNSE